MTIKTREELAAILKDGWKNEVVVNINIVSFLTNETKIYFYKTVDNIPNNFIKICTNDGTFICGIIASEIKSVFTNQTYEVALC